jgi:hypothetical protein
MHGRSTFVGLRRSFGCDVRVVRGEVVFCHKFCARVIDRKGWECAHINGRDPGAQRTPGVMSASSAGEFGAHAVSSASVLPKARRSSSHRSSTTPGRAVEGKTNRDRDW